MKYESESCVVPYRHAIIILLCGAGSELVWWNEILIKVISLRIPVRQASRANVGPRVHLRQTASDMRSNGKKAMGHEYKTGALGMRTCGCPAEFLSKRVNQCDCLWTCLFKVWDTSGVKYAAVFLPNEDIHQKNVLEK